MELWGLGQSTLNFPMDDHFTSQAPNTNMRNEIDHRARLFSFIITITYILIS